MLTNDTSRMVLAASKLVTHPKKEERNTMRKILVAITLTIVVCLLPACGGGASGGGSNPIVTPTPMTVALTSPVNGATLSGTVIFSATVSGPVVGLQYEVDGQPLSSDIASPYDYTVFTTAIADGTHVITAFVHDGTGATKRSDPVTVTVNNAVAADPCAPYASMDGMPLFMCTSSTGNSVPTDYHVMLAAKKNGTCIVSLWGGEATLPDDVHYPNSSEISFDAHSIGGVATITCGRR